MNEYTRGNFKAGLKTLLSTKLRSFWTMLGIIIGVASVITVIGIGSGIKRQVSHQIQHLGRDVIVIRPGELHGSTGLDALSGLNVSGALSAKDVKVVQDVKGVSSVAPISISVGKITRDKIPYSNNLLIGTNGDLPGLLNQSIAYGSFFTYEDEGSKAAVLGDKAAKRLFDEELPLGRTFFYNGQEFIVRGILNEMNTTPLTEQADFNDAIFIQEEAAQELSKNTAPIYQILARPEDPKQYQAVAEKIQKSLYISHGYQNNFKVITGGKDYDSNGTVLALLTQMIAGVASISLLVGGIGIMNVMYVSVAERLHEIGIRKAIGATDKQIISQFVTEASIISLVGGILGVILAFFINIVLRILTDLRPVISIELVIGAILISVIIGVIFGSFPAFKAAKKNPIDALRS